METNRRGAMATLAASAATATTSMLWGFGSKAMAAPARSPVTRPDAEQWDMTSRITGRTYRIFVAKPAGGKPPPPEGYPVVYLNDGDIGFHSAADALALQVGGREVKPAYLVGIGYGRDMEAVARERFADLTPSQPEPAELARLELSPFTKGAVFGQAGLFHRFLMEELRPQIEAGYPVDRRDTSLWGHSLGGLFALHILFNHPEAYRTYLVSSPSINWSGGTVLKDEPKLVAQLKAGTVSPRILITAGEYEERLAAHRQMPPGITREQMEAGLKAFAMVTNAMGLADRLKAAGASVETVVFEGETHFSVVLPAIARGLRFALPL